MGQALGRSLLRIRREKSIAAIGSGERRKKRRDRVVGEGESGASRLGFIEFSQSEIGKRGRLTVLKELLSERRDSLGRMRSKNHNHRPTNYFVLQFPPLSDHLLISSTDA